MTIATRSSVAGRFSLNLILALLGCLAYLCSQQSVDAFVPHAPALLRQNHAGTSRTTVGPGGSQSPPSSSASSSSSSARHASNIDPANLNVDEIADTIKTVLNGAYQSAGVALGAVFVGDESVDAKDIVAVCDEIDELTASSAAQTPTPTDMSVETSSSSSSSLSASSSSALMIAALKFKRYELLTKLMRKDYDAYVATASFLSPSRIPRLELPNLQDVPYDKDADPALQIVQDDDGTELVADCELDSVTFQESPLDTVLLAIFRKLVESNTNGVSSPKPSIDGLLEQGRTFMLQPDQTPEAQHKMVKDTLAGLMTPVLPPFYRIFMSGIVPNGIGTEWDGKQIGPWFYAPFLTSFVTPTFFGFLVGPSRVNRRKDGQLGGLVVEKCKFLQESGCKGLCLHQCKIPAQEFFADELGLPLTVSPNFVTQECQWSFGEVPLPPEEDPSFPKGCLVGCDSRKLVADKSRALCS